MSKHFSEHSSLLEKEELGDTRRNMLEDSPLFCFCLPTSWIFVNELEAPRNSIVSTIFLLLNSMIGSGILAQAYVFKESGIALACLQYLLFGSMIFTGVDLLFRAAEVHKVYNYSELSKVCLGSWGESIVDAAVVVGGFGALLSYIVLIGSLSKSVFEDYVHQDYFESIPYLSFLVSFVLSTPLCLIRQFGHLAAVSYYSTFAVSSVLFLVLVCGPVNSSESRSDNILFISWSGCMHTMGSVVFAFSFASSVFHAYGGIHPKRAIFFRRILAGTTISGVTMCFLTGLVGYLCFRNNTEADILDNFSGAIGVISKLLVVVHLILFIPSDYLVMRYSLFRLLGLQTDIELSDFTHMASTLLITGVVTLLSCWIQSRESTDSSLPVILDLTGGLSGSVVSFILPGMFAVRSLHGWAILEGWILIILGALVPIFVIASLFSFI